MYILRHKRKQQPFIGRQTKEMSGEKTSRQTITTREYIWQIHDDHRKTFLQKRRWKTECFKGLKEVLLNA